MKKIYLLAIIFFLSAFFSFAQITQLWGMTYSGGGPDSGGTMVRINPDGNSFAIAHSFDSLSGFSPKGSLVQAPNGLLYGMTEDGGDFEAGVIFNYDPVSDNYSKVFDFDYYTNGGYPQGSLILADDGKLYGMATSGGANSDGTIFRFDPAGNTFVHLYDFDDETGINPFGSLVQAIDGKLYGLASSGGLNSSGTLFRFNIADSSVAVMHDFALSTGMTPYGSLLASPDANLYGMTYEGGSYNYGVLFSFNLADSVYYAAYDFDNATGSNPYGSLIRASDNLIYGMTSKGGDNLLYGNIFSFDPAFNTFTDLFDFNGANGSSPEGDLMQAANGKLYGMTHLGGANDAGVLFSFDQSTSGYSVLKDFSKANGKLPSGNLIEILSTGIAGRNGLQNIQLYPNPAMKELRFKNVELKAAGINIYDVLGEKVLNLRFENQNPENETGIDVSSLARGVYFIRVLQANNQWVGRFIRE